MSAESDGPDRPSFADLGLHPVLLRTLQELEYETPTPVQCQTVPPLLEGRDLIGQAQTGSGKTAAYALPLLHRLESTREGVQGLILTPTRELALQVTQALRTYARDLPWVRSVAVYGGAPMEPQFRALRQGATVVIGTPGRVIDHLQRGTLSLSHVRMAVLDEADQMLRMGFIEAVEEILGHIPADSQRVLFSATMPPPILHIARASLREPAHIRIESTPDTIPQIEQTAIRCREGDKVEILTRLLETLDAQASIIFVRTQVRAQEVADQLSADGFAAEGLHGGMNQQMRERVIARLRDNTLRCVVATDVAARGIDVEHVSHVINFDLPLDPESYIHRIGRTGRAGRLGAAISLVTPGERRLQALIERLIRQRMNFVDPPDSAMILEARTRTLRNRLVQQIEQGGLTPWLSLVDAWAEAGDPPLRELAAAALRLVAGSRGIEPPRPLQVIRLERPEPLGRGLRAAVPGRYPDRPQRDAAPDTGRFHPDGPRGRDEAPHTGRFHPDGPRGRDAAPDTGRFHPDGPRGRDEGDRFRVEPGMRRLFLAYGRQHGARPGDIVAALANESGITGRDIGQISIQDRGTFVDVREEVADVVLQLREIRFGRHFAAVSVARPFAARPEGAVGGEFSARGHGGPPRGGFTPREGGGPPRGRPFQPGGRPPRMDGGSPFGSRDHGPARGDLARRGKGRGDR